MIDLSADYRLKDASTYADWYGHAHTDPEGLAEAVYGLPELYRSSIPRADLIANPGCYTSTAILALAPLIAEDRIERTRDHRRRLQRDLGGRPDSQARLPLPRGEREPRRLQRRPPPPHARDRPGPHRRRQSAPATGPSR